MPRVVPQAAVSPCFRLRSVVALKMIAIVIIAIVIIAIVIIAIVIIAIIIIAIDLGAERGRRGSGVRLGWRQPPVLGTILEAPVPETSFDKQDIVFTRYAIVSLLKHFFQIQVLPKRFQGTPVARGRSNPPPRRPAAFGLRAS